LHGIPVRIFKGNLRIKSDVGNLEKIRKKIRKLFSKSRLAHTKKQKHKI
jgi:hypothetical protein